MLKSLATLIVALVAFLIISLTPTVHAQQPSQQNQGDKPFSLCFQNDAGGYIHIFAPVQGQQPQAMATTRTDTVILGHWESFNGQILIRWENGVKKIFPRSIFKICEL